MLRAFSSIRKTLINEGKTSRYVRYAVGEFLLIVAGILVALQIQNWNGGRKEQIEEKEILTRISEEVDEHMSFVDRHLEFLIEIRAALEHVNSGLEGERIENNTEYLTSVVRSSSYSYFTPPCDTTTYEEIVGSGKLGLIRNIELRKFVSAYYRATALMNYQGNAVLGDYGQLTFALVPREGRLGSGVADLSDEAASNIVSLVLDSELHRYITPQRNRLNYLNFKWSDLTDQGQELLTAIEAELNK